MDAPMENPDGAGTWTDSWPSSSDWSESSEEASSEYLPDSELDEGRSVNQANPDDHSVQNPPLLAPSQLPVPAGPSVDAAPGFHSAPSWAPAPIQSPTPINLAGAPIITATLSFAPGLTSAPNPGAARFNHTHHNHNPAAHPAGPQFFPSALNPNPASNFAFGTPAPSLASADDEDEDAEGDDDDADDGDYEDDYDDRYAPAPGPAPHAVPYPEFSEADFLFDPELPLHVRLPPISPARRDGFPSEAQLPPVHQMFRVADEARRDRFHDALARLDGDYMTEPWTRQINLSRYVFWNRVSNLPLVPRYWALRVSTQNPFMRARDSQTARSVAQLAWAMHRTLFGPDSPSNPFPLATPAMQPAAGTRDIAGYSLASPVVAGPSSSSAAATATIPVPRPATSFAPAPASVGSSMMPGHRSPSPEQDVPSRDSILRRTQGGRISKAGSARPHGR